MQKIKLKNNVEILNIENISSYKDFVRENDKRDILVITISNNTIENLRTILFTDPVVLSTISIYGEITKLDKNGQPEIDSITNQPIKIYELQGIQEGYNIPYSITQNFNNNSFEIKIARKSLLEQQIVETQLALAEFGVLLSSIGGKK